MDLIYAITPFFAWLIAGISKFILNSMKAGQLAFNQIGYGGLPSNHTAIVSSTATMVAIRDGISNPAFGVAVALTFIVALDASSLRKEVGKHAEIINNLNKNRDVKTLRESMGHTRLEVTAGILVGIFSAYILELFWSSII